MLSVSQDSGSQFAIQSLLQQIADSQTLVSNAQLEVIDHNFLSFWETQISVCAQGKSGCVEAHGPDKLQMEFSKFFLLDTRHDTKSVFTFFIRWRGHGVNGKRGRSDVEGTGDVEEPTDFALTKLYL